MQTVLLIDDDVELVGMLKEYLELVGMLKEYLELESFDVQIAYDSDIGAQMALKQSYDIVVLHVMMPKLNGIEALKAIRQHSIMLTAKGDNTDRIIGLELGADDYVPKPISPREIVARIRAILRRVKPEDTQENTQTNTQESNGMSPHITQQIDVGALNIWRCKEQSDMEWLVSDTHKH